jgi:hypothetical protein
MYVFSYGRDNYLLHYLLKLELFVTLKIFILYFLREMYLFIP